MQGVLNAVWHQASAVVLGRWIVFGIMLPSWCFQSSLIRFTYPVHMKVEQHNRGSGQVGALILLAVIVLGCVMAYWQWKRPTDALVVYCAHDRIFSEKILRDFETETGIAVEVRFDTEATKSLGLTELLLQEKGNPRCDVFWNNEQLAVMQLKKEGVLEPYKGEGFARIPDGYKDADGHWTGFAARMRVWIVNGDARPRAAGEAGAKENGEDAKVITDTLAATELSDLAIAKPLYGTTRTQYTVLWQHLGRDALQRWHDDWRKRGVIEQGGNSTVKDLVAAGTCHVGLTDTDDFFVAKDEGKPVYLLPFRLDDGRVICIPNTVAIIKGTQRLDRAKRLVEYLLSEKVELALAHSPSRQIPLGPLSPANETKLSDEVKQLRAWSTNAYPLSDLGDAADECLAWLRERYAP